MGSQPPIHRAVPARPREPAQAHAPHPVTALERIGLDEARSLLDRGRFFTEYEPLVSLRSGRIAAYEALARFRRQDGRLAAPDRVLAALDPDPGLRLRAELSLKLHQIEHAPRMPVFVNLDPTSFLRAGDARTNPFLTLFSWSRTRVVVEVLESMAAADAVRASRMFGALRARGLKVALDDVGAAGGLLTFEALSEAHVIKFDRTLMPRMREPRARALVQALARMARENGARTVFEGIETPGDLETARDLGVDLAQGFLFRDRVRSVDRR
ncbi:MAG TPA: EAL domain-containing protein [Anaeromyxobacteraceae bacterium]|nr:EAL domain-containing protein [Anaeromyxobacteraceae bacterium]